MDIACAPTIARQMQQDICVLAGLAPSSYVEFTRLELLDWHHIGERFEYDGEVLTYCLVLLVPATSNADGW